ncbi:hypothetical protein [Thermococcus sp.]|uniref:hypothetical protein n=1 Tax=Thermococcus sp. TaxID=35749 RepID=UPI002603FC7E|nr:hypothetical protein [Thermococcus sp.]
MRREIPIVISFVFVALSAYIQPSNRVLAEVLLAIALVLLFIGVHMANRSKPERDFNFHLALGVLLPIFLFITYGNPLYLVGGLLFLIPLVWKFEKAILLLIPAGLILGILAARENSYVAKLVGSFLIAVSIIFAVASLYFWLKFR